MPTRVPSPAKLLRTAPSVLCVHDRKQRVGGGRTERAQGSDGGSMPRRRGVPGACGGGRGESDQRAAGPSTRRSPAVSPTINAARASRPRRPVAWTPSRHRPAVAPLPSVDLQSLPSSLSTGSHSPPLCRPAVTPLPSVSCHETSSLFPLLSVSWKPPLCFLS